MMGLPFVVLALAVGLGIAAARVGVSGTVLATDVTTASTAGAAAGCGAAFATEAWGDAVFARLRDDGLVGVVKTTSRVFAAMQHRP